MGALRMALAFDRSRFRLDRRSGGADLDQPGNDRTGFQGNIQVTMMSKKPTTFLMRHYLFLPQIVAIFFGYLTWLAMDRTPPLILFDGKVTPAIVRKGQEGVKVVWDADFAGRDCPGYSQRELVDSGHHLWPELRRARAGIFKADPDHPLTGKVVTPPLIIPNLLPGPARYRVTQFYYCNWLQRLLEWPIIQTSPFIKFEVVK
jgi:hypothetical protein